MNKLLLFPLAMLFILSLFVFLESAVQPSGTSDDYTNTSGITIDEDERYVEIPSAEPQTFNIWGTSGPVVIVIAAIAVGIISGISFLGSGLSPLSQSMIFNSIVFFGIWTCLTVVSASLMFENIVMIIIWLCLTMMFMLGLSIHLTGDDE
jgi:hypothetical protein